VITVLRSEVYRLIDTVAALSGEIFYQQAPDGTALPYCVFLQTAGNVFEDTADEFGESYVQISVFSSTAAQAESIAQSVHDVFFKSAADFSVTGYNVNLCSVEGRRSLVFDDVYQEIIEIRISLKKE